MIVELYFFWRKTNGANEANGILYRCICQWNHKLMTFTVFWAWLCVAISIRIQFSVFKFMANIASLSMSKAIAANWTVTIEFSWKNHNKAILSFIFVEKIWSRTSFAYCIWQQQLLTKEGTACQVSEWVSSEIWFVCRTWTQWDCCRWFEFIPRPIFVNYDQFSVCGK